MVRFDFVIVIDFDYSNWGFCCFVFCNKFIFMIVEILSI